MANAPPREKMTIRDYAIARGMTPQLVHYHLRNHPEELQSESCQCCGSRVLDVRAADGYFGYSQPNTQEGNGNASEDTDGTRTDA